MGQARRRLLANGGRLVPNPKPDTTLSLPVAKGLNVHVDQDRNVVWVELADMAMVPLTAEGCEQVADMLREQASRLRGSIVSAVSPVVIAQRVN